MKLLIDMNLSPRWVEIFEQHGWDTLHWQAVGDPRATDRSIMQWARRGYTREGETSTLPFVVIKSETNNLHRIFAI